MATNATARADRSKASEFVDGALDELKLDIPVKSGDSEQPAGNEILNTEPVTAQSEARKNPILTTAAKPQESLASEAVSSVMKASPISTTVNPAYSPGIKGAVNRNLAEAPNGAEPSPSAPNQQLRSNDLVDSVAEDSQQRPKRNTASGNDAVPLDNIGIPPVESRQAKLDEQAARLREDGKRELMQEGVVTKPAPLNAFSRANRRFAKTAKFIKEKIDRKIKRPISYSGMSFYETIYSDHRVPPHCVSISHENLIESLREPNSRLLDLVNSKLLEAQPSAEPLTVDACLADMRLLVNTINSLEIEVTLEKTPVNVAHSIQVRTLRVRWGRGIGLHPTQTKVFNADYDGDPAILNLDQSQLNRYARAMDRLVDMEGNPTIDPDFFPIDLIEQSQEDDISKELKDRLGDNWDQALVDAYIVLCKFDKAKPENWRDFLGTIDQVAEEKSYNAVGHHRNEVSSQILQTLYDFSANRRGLSLRTQLGWLNPELSNNIAESDNISEPFVLDLINLTDDIVAGRPAPSFEDFNLFYNKYYGDVEGSKNVPFRLLADFAKAINRTEFITVGSDLFGIDAKGQLDDDASVSIFDLWQFTCAAAVSKQISGRTTMGSRQLAVSTHVRTMVQQQCPIPDWNSDTFTNEDFRAWMNDFIFYYNRNRRMLRISQISYRNGMLPVNLEKEFKDIDRSDPDTLARALVSVYGDVTIERVFPTLPSKNQKKWNTATSGRLGNFTSGYTLERFSMYNRVTFDSRNGVAAFQDIKRKLNNDTYDAYDVVLLIANRRTKQCGEYHKQFDELAEGLSKGLKNLLAYRNQMFKKSTKSTVRDYNEYRDAILEIMNLMSPEMFLFFGMDSPTTFANSKWGKKLISASRDSSAFKSVIVSMMIEYRFGRSSKILQEMKDAKADKLDALDSAFELELESLASSSMVWNTIASEVMEGSRFFKACIQRKGTNFEKSYAKEFWSRNDIDKYGTLMTFLKSDEPFETKIAVLADITRDKHNYAYIHPNEVMGQLAYHPDRLHAGDRFDMDNGIRSDLDALKESADRLSSYMSKTPAAIRKEANKIIGWATKHKSEFEQHLVRLSSDPGYMVYVDPILAADAIASVFDKTYSDSEKIKQQAAVNGYFGCVSLQRNGGFYTHLYMTDNSVVNMVGYDQLTPQDIVRVLGDPTVELYVYDEFGTPSPEPITRESLCGGNTIDDVLVYLNDNPRIALSCRRFIAGISADVDGTARMTAINNYQWVDNNVELVNKGVGDDVVNQVFSLLNDRPRFLAMAALFSPSENNVGRNMSEQINDTISNLCKFIHSVSNESTVEKLDSIKRAFPSLSRENLLKLRMQGRFDESDHTELDEEAVNSLYEEVLEELLDCIGIVSRANITAKAAKYSPFSPIDRTSVVSYYDVRQQMSGARTAMMIGVEGSETKKNLIFKQFLQRRKDNWTMSANGVTPIPLAEGLDQASDQSFVRSGSLQIGSVSKFLEVKREKGAETYNAKAKKYGDDGTNSIVKFIRAAKRALFDRYGKGQSSTLPDGTWSIEDAKALRDKINAVGSKNEAVPILAQALVDADIRMGYIDVNKETGEIEDHTFVLSDYYNRADLMIAENSDGTLVIRTLEQLSAACRNRLSDDAIASEDADIVYAELEQIVMTLGTDMDPVLQQLNTEEVAYRCMQNVPVRSVIHNVHRVDRSLRQRSSSVERNYFLNKQIYDEIEAWGRNKNPEYRYEPPSKKKIAEFEKHAENMLAKKNSSWVIDRIKEAAGFNIVGLAWDKLIYVPGSNNMIIFSEDEDESKQSNTLELCRKFGVTACFYDGLPAWASKYRQDIINISPIGSDPIYIIPFFDMKLNGCMSDQIMPAPAEIPISPDNVITNVEDTTFEFREGDATYHMTKELADRIRIHFRDTVQLLISRLFPNVLSVFPEADFEIDYCSNEEIQKYIVNGNFNPETLTIDGFDRAVVDIGVLEGTANFEREKLRFGSRLEEYKRNFDSTDSQGILSKDVDNRYDSIVGFVKIIINGGDSVVLAPIWPFHLEETGSVPTTYRIEKLEKDADTHSFNLEWEYTGSLDGQYIKAFEGIGASNKMIASSERAKSRSLENGLAIDGFYSTSSVASRLFPANKRIHTMISVMMMTRIDPQYSYNFAEIDGSFPYNQDIKEALLNYSLGITDWKRIVKENPDLVYHVDPQINSIVKWWVNKCLDFETVNPSMLLATRTPNGVLFPKITEFEAFLDPGYNFQRAWMKLMNKMCPGLIPADIEDDSSQTLFKPVKKNEGDHDYGVLQMAVPHFLDDGTSYSVLENVYLSVGFFGDEFSGFKKVNINGFRRSLDDLNVAQNVNGFDLSQVLAYGRAGMSSISDMKSNIIVDDTTGYFKKDSELKRILDNERYGKVLALTGHRPGENKKKGTPDKLWGRNMNDPHYAEVKKQLADYCKKHHIDTIVSGMALGFDQLGAEVALDLGLKLVAAVPCKGQEKLWPKDAQRKYHEILNKAYEVFYISNEEYDPSKSQMQDRNKWMIDNADEVFALFNGTPGGTKNAVDYAELIGKPIKRLDPRDVVPAETK